MLKLERQLFIEKELHEKGSVLVSELSKVLDCSEETIRRDIKEMEAAGMLNKIHGGAYLPDKYDKGVPIELRESFFASEKEQMADKAVDIINQCEGFISVLDVEMDGAVANVYQSSIQEMFTTKTPEDVMNAVRAEVERVKAEQK